MFKPVFTEKLDSDHNGTDTALLSEERTMACNALASCAVSLTELLQHEVTTGDGLVLCRIVWTTAGLNKRTSFMSFVFPCCHREVP